MSGEEMKYIQRAFDTNWIAPLGQNVDEFEEKISNYVSREYAVAMSSGTAAIHLGLKALGVGQGDIVFCSSFTFSASCNPIHYVGAKPVFIDCEYDTWNMCPKALRKAYEKYPNPKVIVVVDLYGNPANYDEILKISKAHNTPLLEDSAESLGAFYKGKQAGSFGEISILSFNGNKIITTSGGGMLVTDNEAIAKKVKYWATQSRESCLHYEHKEIGYNYRLSNVSAGIGLGQMSVLDKRVEQKKAIFDRYKKGFCEIRDIEMMPVSQDNAPNYWLSAMTILKGSKVKVSNIISELDKFNIESRPLWKPMHIQPVFSDCDFIAVDKKVISEDLYERGLCLPSDTKMTKEEQDGVISIIKNLF